MQRPETKASWRIPATLTAVVLVGGIGIFWWASAGPSASSPKESSKAYFANTPANNAKQANTPIAPDAMQAALADAARQVRPITIKSAPSSFSMRSSKVKGTLGINDVLKVAEKDADLESWLKAWDADVKAGRTASPDRLSTLRDILKGSHLPCRTLVEIGNAVQFYSGDELAGIIFSAAVIQGDKQLKTYEPESEEAKPTLRAMTGTLGVFWRLIDGQGKHEFVSSVALVNKDTLKWASADDPEFKDKRQHAKISSAECVYLAGNPKDAVAAAQAIDTTGMDDEELAGTAWIRGLALFRESRYAEAAPEFSTVASHKGSMYAQAASASLVDIYALLHDKSQTAEQLKRHVTEYGLTEAQALRIAVRAQKELQSK